MAGIGFALRELVERDSFLGPAQGYLSAAVITCGPWIMTIACLAGLGFFLDSRENDLALDTFRMVLIYNFSLSLVFTGPVHNVATRYLADRFYERSVHSASAVLMSVMALTLGIALIIGVFLYGVVLDLPGTIVVGAIMNLVLISGVWGVSIFLSALKEYMVYATVFLVGLSVSFVATIAMTTSFGPELALMGFNVGFAVVLFVIVARVFVEYPAKATWPKTFFSYFPRFWQLAVGGFVLNAGLWVDKWLMWFAPDNGWIGGQMPYNANYDVAMFLVYLTIVPALTLMLVSFETGFFDRYTRYNATIRDNTRRDVVEAAGNALAEFAITAFSKTLVVQGMVSALAFFYAPYLVSNLGGAYVQVGIFRAGVVGAYFHVMFLFLCLILSYFDQREQNLNLQLVFLVCNCIFTYGSIQLGYAYYGAGYALASMLVFVAGCISVYQLFSNLTYRTYLLGLRTK